MPLDTAFLAGVSYAEGKNSVKVSFESKKGTESEEFSFTPEIRLPENKAVTAIARELVSPNKSKELFFREGQGNCTIHSSYFSSLKKAHSLLSLSLNAFIPLLEPERQFLLSNNLSYFQSRKENKQTFPEKINLNKCILSNELRIPTEKLPVEKEELGLKLIENNCFSNHKIIYTSHANPVWRFVGNPSGFFELDLSNAMHEKILELNLGFETVNCDCCKPSSLRSRNVLPNSLVETEFLENGFFFDSMIPSFSAKFHSLNPLKESREKRKREFFLRSFPIGPFYSGEKAMVPLSDARKLVKQGKAIVHKKTELSWHCVRKKSFLSNEILRLTRELNEAKQCILESEKNRLEESGLNAFDPLSDPSHHINSAKQEAFSVLLSSVSMAVSSPKNPLFNDNFSTALEAIRSEILADYNEFLERSQSEPIYLSAGRAFIRNIECLTDLALISKQAGMPMLAVF